MPHSHNGGGEEGGVKKSHVKPVHDVALNGKMSFLLVILVILVFVQAGAVIYIIFGLDVPGLVDDAKLTMSDVRTDIRAIKTSLVSIDVNKAVTQQMEGALKMVADQLPDI